MFALLQQVICKNDYVQKCSNELKKDPNSLSFLISKPLSQNQCIKVGTGVELVFRDLISQHTKLENIKSKNQKGVREKDHLFLDAENKVIYYAECKSNLNLDTEKSKSTVKKCLTIKASLQEDYPDHTIKTYLLGARYLRKQDIPPVILAKYTKISENVVGINDYMKELGVPSTFADEQEYSKTLNFLVEEMYSPQKKMLHKLSVKDLKAKLGEMKLSVLGRKSELYQRLVNNMDKI